MKPGIRNLVGKQIVDVVTARNPGGGPGTQALLVFSDGTRLEVRLQASRVGVTTIPAKPGEDVEALLKRDLDAWEMAKAAVARARRRR